jgi:WD40 repeat protein
MNDRPDVFVSYRHRDPHQKWVRETLVPALKAEGYSVVLDVDDKVGFTPGRFLVDEMERAGRARLTVAVVDSTYGKSGQTAFELRTASKVLAVLRDPVDPADVPVAAQVVDLVNDDNPDRVVRAVHEAVRRVFVLEAEEDEEWVVGVLLPALDNSGVSTGHTGDLTAGEVWSDTVTRRLTRADRVVVVLSSAYLRDVHPRVDLIVTTVENRENRVLALPVQREDGIDVPPRFAIYQIIDASRPDQWDDALRRLCRAVGVDLAPPAAPPPCPYPGMRPFASGQADVFFGREAEIDDVLSGLRRERFVAVIGPSASGKSSLALAGVAARLAENGLYGGGGWPVEVIRPGPRPVGDLRQAVERARGQTGRSGDSKLALVIDQYEECYTSGADDPDDFERELVELLDDPAIHVVVTVRADFYPQLMSGRLWPLVNKSRVEVVPLSGDALREAVRAPARHCDVVVEGALVERLAAETEGQPGLLPFLQETLVTLWGGLDHRLLTLEAYTTRGRDESSGVLQAIRRVSDGATGEIAARHAAGERIVRNILVRLVQFGEGRPDTRRRVPVAELEGTAPDHDTFVSVFDTLVDARLVTTDRDAAGELVADLSHEAIIRGWPTLARWIEEDKAAEATGRRLRADAAVWARRADSGHAEQGLLETVELEEARRWLAAAEAEGRGQEPLVSRHVAASVAAQDRRRRRRRLALGGTFAVLVLVAAGFAVLALRASSARRDAEQASIGRLALQVRSSSTEIGDAGLPLRALLVRAADSLDTSEISLVEMLTTAERQRLIAARIEPPRGVGFDALWADDEIVAAGDGFGHVAVWPRAGEGVDRGSERTFEIGRTTLAMARRPGTNLLAVGGGNGSAAEGGIVGSKGAAFLVDLGAASLTPEPLALDGDSPVSALAFAGDSLIVARWNGRIAVVNPDDPQAVPDYRLNVPPGEGVPEKCSRPEVRDDRMVQALAVDATGRWLAAGTNNCLVGIWDLRALNRPPQVLVGHAGKVRALAFVPGTAALLSAGDDRSIRRWDVGPHTGRSTVLTGSADEERVIALCVSPDGRWVLTAGRDHQVRRWPLEGTELTLDPVALGAHSQTVRAVACPTPRTFASLGADGLVLWDLDRPPRGGSVVPVAPSVVRDVDVRPGSDADVAVATTPDDGERGPGAVEVRRASGDTDAINLGSTFPRAVAYSPDGATLAVSGDQPGGEPDDDPVGWVRVYDADTLNEIEGGQLPAGDGPTMRAVAVRGADEYAVGDDAGSVRMVVNGEERAPARVDSAVRSMAYMPDGHLLVGDEVGYLSCFDPAHPDRPPGRVRLARAVASVAAGTDETVVAGIADGAAVVFVDARVGGGDADEPACDPGAWTTQVAFGVASDAVTSVAIAASDSVVVLGNGDGEARFWDVARRRQVGRLTTGHDQTDAFSAMAPDASVIAVAAGDTVDVYELDQTSLRQQLCRLAGRELTEDELDAYIPDEAAQEAGRCG